MIVAILFKLSVLSALITGCSKGFGFFGIIAPKHITAHFITIFTSFKRLGEVIKARAIPISPACHFSNSIMSGAIMIHVENEHDKIHNLIHDTDTILQSTATQHDNEVWDNVTDTNLNALFIFIRDFVKEVLKKDSEVIYSPVCSFHQRMI